MIIAIIICIILSTRHGRYLVNESDDTAILNELLREERELEEKLALYELYSDVEYMGGRVNNKVYNSTRKTKKQKAAKAKNVSFNKELAIIEAEEARKIAIAKDLKKINKQNNRAMKEANGGSYITYELLEECKTCPSFQVCDRLYKLNLVGSCITK